MLAVPLFLIALQAPGNSLTLEEAVETARVARGRPGIAAAGVAEARGQRRLAGLVPNPTLSYEHTGDPPRQHLFVEQPFSWLLTRSPDRAAARAGIGRAQADSVATMAALVQEVRIAFYEALGANQILELVREQVGFNDSLARIARARLTAGDISQLEYEQAAQDARRGQQLLSETREHTLIAEAVLAHAVGWTGPAAPVPAGSLDAGLAADTSRMLVVDSIPSVRAAVADSLAAAFTLRSARLARVPMPSVTGGAEWDDPDQPGKTLSVLGFAVPLPIWNWGNADVALARARASLAAAETRETRLEAGRLVAEAQASLVEAARRARFARDSLIPGARALRERAVLAYRAGETGVLPVLDALRAELEIVVSGVQELVAYQSAVARWRALAGRTE